MQHKCTYICVNRQIQNVRDKTSWAKNNPKVFIQYTYMHTCTFPYVHDLIPTCSICVYNSHNMQLIIIFTYQILI